MYLFFNVMVDFNWTANLTFIANVLCFSMLPSLLYKVHLLKMKSVLKHEEWDLRESWEDGSSAVTCDDLCVQWSSFIHHASRFSLTNISCWEFSHSPR